MQIIFLPGFSLYNRDEMNAVSDYLNSKGLKVQRVEWNHWADDTIAWDTDAEVEKVKEVISKIGEDSFILMGKSIGTFVAVNVLKSINKSQLKEIVLMGLPLNDLSDEERALYKEVLFSAQDVGITVLQNESDSHGSAADVTKLLDGVNLQLIIKEGVTDHKYNYPEDIYNLVKNS